MRSADLIRFARDAATGNPLRASLLVLAMAIGVAAVVVLTALGDGIHAAYPGTRATPSQDQPTSAK